MVGPNGTRILAAWATQQGEQLDWMAPPAGPDEMGCFTLSEDKRFACTREFGHDGNHVAHGPGPRVVGTWQRKATDRSGSEE